MAEISKSPYFRLRKSFITLVSIIIFDDPPDSSINLEKVLDRTSPLSALIFDVFLQRKDMRIFQRFDIYCVIMFLCETSVN